jgi:UDP-glucose 4-epimerase
MIAHQPVQVFARRQQGDPGCIRDYVYIRDVVNANLAAMQGKISDRILNVGTGAETNTLQLAQYLKSLLNSHSEIHFGPIRPGDVERSLLDADRLAELLGPTVSVAAGLAETATWFQQHKR